MKILILLVILIAAINVSASTKNGDKLFSYQENYPKSPHWYEFKIDSYCEEYENPISIQEFTSEKKYEGKSVRIIHIYAEANNKNCKKLISAAKSQKTVIPVDLKRMSHIYVTYSSDLTLSSGH